MNGGSGRRGETGVRRPEELEAGLAHYHELGYGVGRRVFSPHEIAELARAFDPPLRVRNAPPTARCASIRARTFWDPPTSPSRGPSWTAPWPTKASAAPVSTPG